MTVDHMSTRVVPAKRSAASRWMNRLFNGLTAISAALLLVVIAVWVRGYYATDSIRFQPRIDYVLHGYVVAWGRGYIAMAVEEARPRPDGPRFYMESERPIALNGNFAASLQWFHVAGVRFATQEGVAMINVPFREYFLFFPCWLAVLASGVLPAVWVRRRRMRRRSERRLAEGLCVKCGYDLRASPGRCPECGMAAPV